MTFNEHMSRIMKSKHQKKEISHLSVADESDNERVEICAEARVNTTRVDEQERRERSYEPLRRMTEALQAQYDNKGSTR